MNGPASSRIVADPRRRTLTPMLLCRCWCGRAYTVTPEAAERYMAGESPCPDRCGKGAE